MSVAPHFIIINRSNSKPTEPSEKEKQADYVAGLIVIGGIILWAIFVGIMSVYEHFRNK